jgi:hypothetical protein
MWGLMGALAVLKSGGEAAGVIPDILMAREIGHNGLTKFHIVRSTHASKALIGRPVGCVCRVAGRVRDAGGVLRGGDVDAAWTAREAMRNP